MRHTCPVIVALLGVLYARYTGTGTGTIVLREREVLALAAISYRSAARRPRWLASSTFSQLPPHVVLLPMLPVYVFWQREDRGEIWKVQVDCASRPLVRHSVH